IPKFANSSNGWLQPHRHQNQLESDIPVGSFRFQQRSTPAILEAEFDLPQAANHFAEVEDEVGVQLDEDLLGSVRRVERILGLAGLRSEEHTSELRSRQ